MKRLYESILDKIDVADADIEIETLFDPRQSQQDFCNRALDFKKLLVPKYGFKCTMTPPRPRSGKYVDILDFSFPPKNMYIVTISIADIDNNQGYHVDRFRSGFCIDKTIFMGPDRRKRFKVDGPESQALFNKLMQKVAAMYK